MGYQAEYMGYTYLFYLLSTVSANKRSTMNQLAVFALLVCAVAAAQASTVVLGGYPHGPFPYAAAPHYAPLPYAAAPHYAPHHVAPVHYSAAAVHAPVQGIHKGAKIEVEAEPVEQHGYVVSY